MPSTSFFNSVKTYLFDHYANKPGKMLVHTGAIGWALSAAAQIFAVGINDKISKKDKMFMIPQEAADAAVNVLSFYLITQSCTTIASKLVRTGRWLPKSVAKYLSDNKIKHVGERGFSVLDDANLPENLKKEYNHFKDGIDVIATTLGAIFSCNILTPIVRNNIAARRQKQILTYMSNKQEMNKPSDKNNSVHAFAKPMNMQAFQSGSLKI